MESKKYFNIKTINFLLFITIISIIGLFFGCNSSNKEDGFFLEEFTIDNNEMRSIVDSMVEMHLPVLQSGEKKQILSLNLSQKDSALFFIFSIRNEKELIYKYIYRENKRIVGYTNSGDINVILLSDIDDLSNFGSIFERFIHPLGNSKLFNYMKYPHNLYIGEGENTWPTYELFYDPTYIIYSYVNGIFSQPHMTKNPNLEITIDRTDSN